ncbi:MAG: hypothetical protein RLZZ244_1828 [Verrucomicrobiota bacterium]
MVTSLDSQNKGRCSRRLPSPGPCTDPKSRPATASLVRSFFPMRKAALLLACLCPSLLPALHAQSPPQRPLASRTPEGFAVPQPHPSFAFPRDHGSHPEFKVEWWYLTGHLFDSRQRRFGFQATFFRHAAPPGTGPDRTSPQFRSDELFLFHAALLDASTGKFVHHERMARAGWEAHASRDTLEVRLADAALRLIPDAPQATRFWLESTFPSGEAFSLRLTPLKPLVFFGKEGVSRKGDSDTAASWYLTFPRMEVAGDIRLGDAKIPVTGQAWMDHEISSSQLTPEQSGWDWAGIQLSDGREIMTYRLRRKDGSTDPASALVWVDRQGKLTHYDASQFQWKPQSQWKSPRTRGEYPLPVVLHCIDPETGHPRQFQLQPLALDQELHGRLGGLSYWEGACHVLSEGKPAGSAYVELTGYASDLSKSLR